MKLVFLNSNIMTVPGYYKTTITAKEEILEYLKLDRKIISAIGHQSTVDIINILLGTNLKVNRMQYKHTQTDVCIIFKLNARIGEGKVLTKKEIEDIGYSFFVTTLEMGD